MDGMKTGTVSLGSASLHLGYSGVIAPNKRGLLREISEFNSSSPGNSDGTALLEEVCAQADMHKIVLLLKADTQRLKSFYERHGFVAIQENSDILMARQHK